MALLRKAFNWLPGAKRPPASPQSMPVVLTGLRRMLHHNEHITGWQGVLRRSLRLLGSGGMAGSQGLAESPARAFARRVAQRYGSARPLLAVYAFPFVLRTGGPEGRKSGFGGPLPSTLPHAAEHKSGRFVLSLPLPAYAQAKAPSPDSVGVGVQRGETGRSRSELLFASTAPFPLPYGPIRGLRQALGGPSLVGPKVGLKILRREHGYLEGSLRGVADHPEPLAPFMALGRFVASRPPAERGQGPGKGHPAGNVAPVGEGQDLDKGYLMGEIAQAIRVVPHRAFAEAELTRTGPSGLPQREAVPGHPKAPGSGPRAGLAMVPSGQASLQRPSGPLWAERYRPSAAMALRPENRRLRPADPGVARKMTVIPSGTRLPIIGLPAPFALYQEEPASTMSDVLFLARHRQGRPESARATTGWGEGLSPLGIRHHTSTAWAQPPVHVPLGPGRPLAAGPRRIMERFLQTDFGHVRIHAGPFAARVAAALKAQAFTIGRHIFFAKGKAAFHTPEGMALLGHELTHVRQGHDISGFTSDGVLPVQVQEREAEQNQALLRRALPTERPLAPWPLLAMVDQPVRQPGRATVTTALPGAALKPTAVPPPPYTGTPELELAKIPIRRAAADRAVAAEPPPVAEAPAPARGEKGPDLDALARQVYDLIMQRLSLERERAGYR